MTQKKRNPILIILNTRVPFFLGHPVHLGYFSIMIQMAAIQRIYVDNQQMCTHKMYKMQLLYKQDCGHFFPCIIKMQIANRNAQTRLYKMQDAVMLKQDCEHISHGIFNYADRKHKCKHVIKCGVNHKATWRSRNYALLYACSCNHKVIMSPHTK